MFIVLIPLSFWFAWATEELVSFSPLNIPDHLDWVFDPASAAAWFLALSWFMDNLGWRLHWLHRIGLVRTPDLNGLWNGEIRSSYSDFGTKTIVQVRIKQDWTRCQIHLRVPDSSSSTSLSASIFLDRIDPHIVYTYVNNPESSQVETMTTHYGTAELDYRVHKENRGNMRELKGRFYSGRSRDTHGELVLWQEEPTD